MAADERPPFNQSPVVRVVHTCFSQCLLPGFNIKTSFESTRRLATWVTQQRQGVLLFTFAMNLPGGSGGSRDWAIGGGGGRRAPCSGRGGAHDRPRACRNLCEENQSGLVGRVHRQRARAVPSWPCCTGLDATGIHPSKRGRGVHVSSPWCAPSGSLNMLTPDVGRSLGRALSRSQCVRFLHWFMFCQKAIPVSRSTLDQCSDSKSSGRFRCMDGIVVIDVAQEREMVVVATASEVRRLHTNISCEHNKET